MKSDANLPFWSSKYCLFQYVDMLHSNQNRPLRGLSILWALGQPGVRDLSHGLKGLYCMSHSLSMAEQEHVMGCQCPRIQKLQTLYVVNKMASCLI